MLEFIHVYLCTNVHVYRYIHLKPLHNLQMAQFLQLKSTKLQHINRVKQDLFQSIYITIRGKKPARTPFSLAMNCSLSNSQKAQQCYNR